MSDSKAKYDLEAELDNCIESKLFLERIAVKTSESLRPSDLMHLLEEVSRFIEAGSVSLNLSGKWLSEVPSWLKKLPPPQKSHFSKLRITSQDEPISLLMIPFNQGWGVFWDKPKGFSLDNLRLADSITEMISLAASAFQLRNEKMQAHLLEHERKLTATIWRNIIPTTLPDINSYLVSSHWQPAKDFGGDFYFTVDNWLILGDVSGKGMTAAFIASMFIPALRAATTQENFLAALDHALYHELNKVEMFATLVVLKLKDNGEVVYYNLGHTPVFLKCSESRIERLEPTTHPLGTFPISSSQEKLLNLKSGDIICLYSDGLLEAQQEGEELEFFGEDRITHEVNNAQTPKEILENLKESLKSWQIKDDLTVVIIEYHDSRKEEAN